MNDFEAEQMILFRSSKLTNNQGKTPARCSLHPHCSPRLDASADLKRNSLRRCHHDGGESDDSNAQIA